MITPNILTHMIALVLGALMAAGIMQLHTSKVRMQGAVALGNLSAQYIDEIATLRADHQKAADKRAEEVRAEQAALTTKYQGALNEALARQTALQTERDRARAAADSLRHQARTAAGRIHLPDTPASAVAEYATAAGELLAQCGEALAEVAGKADGHASDVKTLMDAWPSTGAAP